MESLSRIDLMAPSYDGKLFSPSTYFLGRGDLLATDRRKDKGEFGNGDRSDGHLATVDRKFGLSTPSWCAGGRDGLLRARSSWQ